MRRFAQKGLSDVFLKGKIKLSLPHLPCNVVLLFELPAENNKHPNFEWKGGGRGVDCFVLWSYPIWLLTMSQQFFCQLLVNSQFPLPFSPWRQWKLRINLQFLYLSLIVKASITSSPMLIPLLSFILQIHVNAIFKTEEGEKYMYQ